MLPRFQYGDTVRVTRNARNDGTFPGKEIGDLLVRRGSMGVVRDVGSYLQDQIIYSIYFFQEDMIVGCREEELLGEDETWVESKFEVREKVLCRITLAVGGEIRATAGTKGEIMRVLRDLPGGVQYHLHVPGWVLQVPENALEALPLDQQGGEIEPEDAAAEEDA